MLRLKLLVQHSSLEIQRTHHAHLDAELRGLKCCCRFRSTNHVTGITPIGEHVVVVFVEEVLQLFALGVDLLLEIVDVHPHFVMSSLSNDLLEIVEVDKEQMPALVQLAFKILHLKFVLDHVDHELVGHVVCLVVSINYVEKCHQ